jgi:protoporphyrinogen/coproporphyrinogen III oxidase
LVRAAWGVLRGASGSAHALGDDPTVTQAIGGHLGQEVVDRLVDPLLGGINASSSDRLSLRSAAANLAGPAAAARLMSALREQGESAARGNIGVEVGAAQRPVFLAPRTGVHALVERLRQQLVDAIRSETSVSHVSRVSAAQGGGWRVTIDGSRSLHAPSVVMATPAFISAQLIEHDNPNLANELSAIRTASVALTQLTFPASAQLPTGSGMLVPRIENRFMTASSWWNQKWPHLQIPGQVLLRASAGRDGDDRFTQLDDDEVVASLCRDLRGMLGITVPPTEARVTRWNNGFPQYDSGHAERVDRIQRALKSTPGLHITGASYNGIGIPACIRSAKASAQSCVRSLNQTNGEEDCQHE